MQALDPRRIDEDLAVRPWFGHLRHGVAIEFYAERRPPLAEGIALVEIGSHRCVDEVEDAANDTVLIERSRALQRLRNGLACGLFRPAAIGDEIGRVQGVKELDQRCRRIRMDDERGRKIALRKAEAELPEVVPEG